MMASRRCTSTSPRSVRVPWPSGPRWASAALSSLAARVASNPLASDQPNTPPIPHMCLFSGIRDPGSRDPYLKQSLRNDQRVARLDGIGEIDPLLGLLSFDRANH